MPVSRFWRSACLACVLLAMLLGACAERTSDAQTEQSDPSPESGQRAAGEAISVSDVSSIPDSPMTSGDVLYFLERSAGEVGAIGAFDPALPGQSRRAAFELSEEQVNELEGAVAGIDDEGAFPVDIDDGEYLVCLSNAFAGHSPGPPYSIVGCDLTQVTGDGGITVSHGEAGVQVSSE